MHGTVGLRGLGSGLICFQRTVVTVACDPSVLNQDINVPPGCSLRTVLMFRSTEYATGACTKCRRPQIITPVLHSRDEFTIYTRCQNHRITFILIYGNPKSFELNHDKAISVSQKLRDFVYQQPITLCQKVFDLRTRVLSHLGSKERCCGDFAKMFKKKKTGAVKNSRHCEIGE